MQDIKFLDVLILSISFYIVTLGIAELQRLLSLIHFSDLFSFFKKDDDECAVEIPLVEQPKPKYDVEAFKRRIELMKDDDGLYEVPEPIKVPIDFTGTEVITENFEIEMDKVLRSR